MKALKEFIQRVRNQAQGTPCEGTDLEGKWEEREARQLPAYTTQLAPMQPLRIYEEEKK